MALRNHDIFLEKFVQEIKELIICVTLSIKVRAVCCDTPVMELFRNSKGYNYFFDYYDMVQGETYDRRIVFLDLFAPQRSKENFRNQISPQHHKGTTPMEILDINLVAVFPRD